MSEEVLYFGYGTNRDPDMMEAIIGRKPIGFEAGLDDYELCVQVWEEIPDNVRQNLIEWDSSFRTYFIRPATGKIVGGVVWKLTRPEFENLVGEWEMHGLWYIPTHVTIRDSDGRTYDAETDIMTRQDIKWVVDGRTYPTFLNIKERMLEVANGVREVYLKRARE